MVLECDVSPVRHARCVTAHEHKALVDEFVLLRWVERSLSFTEWGAWMQHFAELDLLEEVKAAEASYEEASVAALEASSLAWLASEGAARVREELSLLVGDVAASSLMEDAALECSDPERSALVEPASFARLLVRRRSESDVFVDLSFAALTRPSTDA